MQLVSGMNNPGLTEILMLLFTGRTYSRVMIMITRKYFLVISFYYFNYIGSSVGEWLRYSLAVLGVYGSSLLTASQICDGLNSPYA